jgi:hypothetical protein
MRRCVRRHIHAEHYVVAERDCAGRVLELGFDCPGLTVTEAARRQAEDRRSTASTQMPMGHTAEPGYFATVLNGTPQEGEAYALTGRWLSDRNGAMAHLSHALMREPSGPGEYPTVMLTAHAVIETLNAALRRDPVAIRTDALVAALARMLDRAGQRPPTPEEQDRSRRNAERFALFARRGLVSHP